MKFRFATAADRDAVEQLWSYSFEPKGDPFFTYYFTHCYRPEDTLLALEDVSIPMLVEEEGAQTLQWKTEERIIGNMHLRPYTLLEEEGTYPKPVAYIVGVATDPDYRNGGVGRKMLTAALEALRARGDGFTILMPSKAGFYQPNGWALYCHQWERRMSLADLKPLTDKTMCLRQVTSEDEWPILQQIYTEFCQPLHGYAARPEAQWRMLIGSLFAEGVHIVVAYTKAGEPQGYMFYRLGAPEIFVSEMVYTKRRAQQALLGYLYQHRSQGESVRWNEWQGDTGYIFYPDGKSGNGLMPFMMGRVVDVPRAFSQTRLTVGAFQEALRHFPFLYPEDTAVAAETTKALREDLRQALVAEGTVSAGEDVPEMLLQMFTTLPMVLQGTPGMLLRITDPLAAWNDGLFAVSVAEEPNPHIVVTPLATNETAPALVAAFTKAMQARWDAFHAEEEEAYRQEATCMYTVAEIEDLVGREALPASWQSSTLPKKAQKIPVVTLDIADLVLLLLGKITATELYAREERIMASVQGVKLLEAMFPAHKTEPFINEWF